MAAIAPPRVAALAAALAKMDRDEVRDALTGTAGSATVRRTRQGVTAMNQDPNLCPACGAVGVELSSRYCRHHVEEMRRRINAGMAPLPRAA